MNTKIFSFAVIFCSACSEYDIKQLCVNTNNAFDVEEVSVLQDAAAYPGARDAIVMDFDSGDFAADEGWRVVTVEALAMIPTQEFETYNDNYDITIEIYDANNPNTVNPWVITQTVIRSDWEWREIRLPSDAATAGQIHGWASAGPANGHARSSRDLPLGRCHSVRGG